MFCTTCGAQIRDNSKFCTKCGTSVISSLQPIEDVITIPPAKTLVSDIVSAEEKKKIFCTTCGTQIRDNSKFCTNCGTSVVSSLQPIEDVITIPPVNTLVPNIVSAEEKKKIFCTTCGTQIRDNSKFCTNCGTSVVSSLQPIEDVITIPPAKTLVSDIVSAEEKKKIFCTNCGTQIQDKSKFCTNCGAGVVSNLQPIEEVITIPPAKTLVPDIVSAEEKKKIFCTTCGTQIRDNSKFCTNCGVGVVSNLQPIEDVITIPPAKTLVPDIVSAEEKKKIFCTTCGTQIRDNSKFCTNCGAISFISEKPLTKEIAESMPPDEIILEDSVPVEEMNSGSNKRWVYWLFGIVVILFGIAGMIYWTNKPKQTMVDLKEKNDSPLISDLINRKNTDIQNDTTSKNTNIDSAGINQAVQTIILNHENSTNTKLQNDKRQELTDSLFGILVRGEPADIILKSFSQYFITNTPKIKIKKYTRQVQIKTVPAGRKGKSAKYEKFK